jgi:DNA-binding phage protein
MKKSTTELARIVEALTRAARRRGMNDSQWAAAAGLPKETLSRLRGRAGCDLRTLTALGAAAGARLAVLEGSPVTATTDEHFPDRIDRKYEARLLDLCASGILDPDAWRAFGPPFFIAGIAVMVASVRGAPRESLLALAEKLHPGISQPEVLRAWLARSPIRPSRFLPMLKAKMRYAA